MLSSEFEPVLLSFKTQKPTSLTLLEIATTKKVQNMQA